MKIEVNGEEREVRDEARTVIAALAALGVEETRGVAVALNDRVVPRSSWAEQPVEEGDRIEIVRAVQGG